MKKQSLFLIIGMVVMLGLSVVAMAVTNAVASEDPEKALFNQTVELRDEETVDEEPTGISYSYIKSKSIAYNEQDEVVGTVYDVIIVNAYKLSDDDEKGIIELLVGIDTEDLVHVSIVELNQSTWTVIGIKAYIEETFNGITYTDVETLPEFDAANPTAGATATDSTTSIKEAVLDVVNLHYDLIIDVYNGVLGDDYTVVEDTTFEPTDHVTSVLNITESTTVPNGMIYVVTGSGVFYDEYEGAITLWVIVDASGEIVKIMMPADLYGHSPGDRYDNNVLYLDGFIGDTFADVADSISTLDGVAGATNSNTLIKTLLAALVEEVKPADPYDGVLGDNYTVEEDTAFTATTHVTSKLNITSSTTVPNGVIYVVTGTGAFYEDYEGSITLWVIVDSSGEIVKIFMPSELYHHSAGNRYDSNVLYLDGFIGDTFADVANSVATLDGVAGATNSNTLIKTLLTALVSEVGN